MKREAILILLVYAAPLRAQDTTKTSHPLQVSGYAEVYYQYDAGRPADHLRPPFVYSYNRTNEITLNLGYVKASYRTQRTRAHLAGMAGTYANANLAGEQGVLKNVWEANIGIRLSSHRNLWLDAGILPSHIGLESAVGKDCWTVTRSLPADNSPYYESGIRTSYKTPDGKWYLSILLLNGWQRIQRVDGNNTPAFGTQVTLTPSENLTVNASSFIGNGYPDSSRKWRYFHDFYATWRIVKQWELAIGFDIGAEQKRSRSTIMNPWYAPVLLLRYRPAENWFLAGRWEYFRDKFGVIVPLVNGMPFTVQGASLNVDRNITDNLLWRLEGRLLWSRHPFFSRGNSPHRTSGTLTTSLCMALN